MSIFEKTCQGGSVTESQRALDLFTDRDDLVRLFCERLHAEPPEERILFFFGDGGNGKSLLLRYLQTHACKRLSAGAWRRACALGDGLAFREAIASAQAPEAAPVPWAMLDFDATPEGNNRPQEAFYALLMLRRQLAPLGLRFPLYDFAVLWYLKQTGGLTREQVRSLFPAEALDLVDALVQAITGVPWLAVGKAVLGLFDRHLGERFTLYRSRRGLAEVDLEAITRLPANSDLLDVLPELFARDLNTALSLPGAPERLVLFFDTHEALWGRERDLGEAAFFARDAWLRRLLGNLELRRGLLVVVAGRDRPRWPEAGDYALPEDSLDLRLVGHLSAPDAERYLAQAGVRDAGLRAHLATYTGGKPYFLGLCADVVLAAAARGQLLQVSDFAATADLAGRERLLVERLLKYVDAQVEHAVRALSAARAFDWAVYSHLGQKLNFAASEPDFRVLTNFSFVRPLAAPAGAGSETRRYRIHELLRRLLDRDPTTLRADAVLEAYYGAQGEEPAQAEAIYHAFQQDAERGERAWCDCMEAAVGIARWALCERLLEVRREMPIVEPFWLGLAAYDEGEYLARLSRHDPAQDAYTRAVASFDQALALAPDYIYAHNNKGNALRSLGELLAGRSRPTEAQEAYSRAVAEYGKALEAAPGAAYLHRNRAEALVLLGRLPLAEADVEWALLHDPASPLTRGCLGQLRLAQGRFGEAEAIFEALVAGGNGDWQGYLALAQLGQRGIAALATLDGWLPGASASDRAQACRWLDIVRRLVPDAPTISTFRDRLCIQAPAE